MTDDAGAFQEKVADRLGVLPNFFCSAPVATGLIEDLWAFAKSAYLDSPLPSLFKERLFVHLSRFCEVRYCIVRHVGFLVGEGRPAGDRAAVPATIAQTLTLLRRPVPAAMALEEALLRLETQAQAADAPLPGTQDEDDLETGAPRRVDVFGGALEMAGEADLSGHHIMVVEDEYYIATDTARALRGAGAGIIGPCATEEDARSELEDARPDAVVLDINLGAGATFKLAEFLKDNRIPFVFVTGYDPEVIPAEFEGIERIQKPVQFRQVVASIGRLLNVAA